MPDILVVNIRGQAQAVGPAQAGVMRGGLVFEQIGTDILLGGLDPARAIGYSPGTLLRRFMGQLWCATVNGLNFGAIRPYDEGGTNDWHATPTDVTAKGAVGRSHDTNTSSNGCPTAILVEVLTADRPYLVGAHTASSFDKTFEIYNPDTNAWSVVTVPGNWGQVFNQLNSMVHDGLAFFCQNNGGIGATALASVDPSTGGIIEYALPTFTAGQTENTQYRNRFFTLHDRLFLSTSNNQNAVGVNAFVGDILEFSFGAWTTVNVDTNIGEGFEGGMHAVFKISPTKVLIIGHGSERDPAGGLVANVITTVGDAKAGALQNAPGTIATTNAVIPTLLKPSGAGYGGGASAGEASRCYGMTITDDPTGQVRHFLNYFPDGAVGAPTVATVFEVFDENTPMAIINQTPESTSDFAFPESFYGGGAVTGGVDGSTRYVSAQARGWAQGNTGVVVKVSAHGDAMVIAHRGIAGGPYTPGENLTWTGGSGTLIGDGAAEGLFVRDVIGTLPAQDGVVTGGGSGATATINGVLLHSGVTGLQYVVGEILTGSISNATAPVTHIGLGGPGEQLAKVGVVTNGPFVSGDVLTGSIGGGTSTMSTGPLGHHGGAADKTIRARFHNSPGPVGKGIPTAFCTMALGTGIGGTVVKDGGGPGIDEFQNVVADGAVGDTPLSFEWDFLADGVDALTVAQLLFEIDRT